MEILTTSYPDFVTIRFVGELDALSSVQADEAIRQLLDEGRFNIHLDFSALEYISSAGIGVILSHQDEISQNGKGMVFTGLSPKVLNVFQLLGLDKIFPIREDLAQAEAYFTAL
jgi:anti-sigma B factor antagonist